MKISTFDKVICRSPAFGINHTLAAVWEELKLKIAESSPAFYEHIKDVAYAELKAQDEKTRYTIWKYFNRAKYRATPFASFAALAVVNLGKQATTPLVISKKMTLKHFTDWSEKANLAVADVNLATDVLANSSVYFVDQEIRYLKLNERQFELASVNQMPELSAILLLCKRKTSLASIEEMMKYTFDLNRQSTIALLNQMVALQLLFTDVQPNITGRDYFNRLQLPCSLKPSNYIIATRNTSTGSFNAESLNNFPDLFSFFTKHAQLNPQHELTSFKNQFIKRYEQRELSLTMLMDPELGIGYGDLAQLNQLNPLINELSNASNHTATENINYGPLQQFLLHKMMTNKAVDLAEFDGKTTAMHQLANTFSVMFHLYEDQLVLASAGGNTANALLGRFTLASAQLEAYGKEIAQIEMEANPEVLFFDIAYQAEKKVDNVNRRKQLYAYELPILTWSETAEPLDLADIMVTVAHDELILKSKKLGKRLMPRSPSAYNYTRSDLAVYRFLCDIQNQGILTNLNFSLQALFPNLAYYPRVNFKNIIVSPATWLIPKAAFITINSLKLWLEEQQLKSRIKAGNGDQSLCFDLKKEEDLWALWKYGKQVDQDFYVSEALIAEQNLIRDEEDNQYAPEYIVNYYHKDCIYKAAHPFKAQLEQFYVPGSEWLYMEIYCHPAKSNHLLKLINNEVVMPKQKLLKKWFFIRYTDPTPHIRLRLHLKAKDQLSELMEILENTLAPVMQSGIITDFKLKTYRPETLRYGLKRMDLAEQFFNIDSKFVLYLIEKASDEQQLEMNAIYNLLELCDIFIGNLAQQVVFIKKMAESFAKEIDLATTDFKKLNNSFNQMKALLPQAQIKIPHYLKHQRTPLLTALAAHCETEEVKQTLLADLIHMHINRLFITQQRVYEALIYQYALKVIQTKKALSKTQ